MSVLDELVAGALEDQRTRELTVSLEDVKKATLAAPAPIDATRWLKRADGIPVIAEIKRASPSKGHLSDIPDPAALAREYEKGGASAISVLTEGRKFLGSLDDFDKVRAAVHIPVLRKDFIVTDYQIFEARAHGADLVLLIVAALDDAQLKHLLDLAHELGMTVLVETHTREEIERARKAGAKVIGINARNLKNLKVDVNKYNELAADLPDDVIKVAESGVFGAVEVEDYARAGADAVLVGEGVATADNHELAVERLVKAGAQVKASETTPLSEHQGPYWGQFGGRYVPEALITALDELERVYTQAKADPKFHKEFMTLQQRYVGRPSPLTEAPRFSALVKEKTGLDARIFLKREDLNHTGAHKINNALGQALLVKRMGKTRVIAETGSGQHGMFQGAKSYLLETDEGQTLDTYSISAGLDYASVGPEHAWLKDIGRVNYSWATDEEAMNAFRDLSQTEGIIPAIESSHAVAGAYKAAADLKAKGYDKAVMIVNISGRGDKDMATAGKWFGYLTDDQAAALDVTGAHGNTVA